MFVADTTFFFYVIILYWKFQTLLLGGIDVNYSWEKARVN